MVVLDLRVPPVQHERPPTPARDGAHLQGAPSLTLQEPVEIDKVYVSAGRKGSERDSRSRGLSTRGRGTTRVHSSRSRPQTAVRDPSESRRRIDSCRRSASSSRSPSILTAFVHSNRLRRTTNLTVNTSSTATASTLIEGATVALTAPRRLKR